MAQDWDAFAVRTREGERSWTAEGLPVLRARSALPEPACAGAERAGRIGRFYRTQERAFYRYCEKDLLPWRASEGRAAVEAGRVPECRAASLTWRETYRAGRLWSLCTELSEDAAPGEPWRAQWGDVWDLKTGYPIPAGDFFPAGERWKRRFLAAAEAEIARQEREGISRFYPGWRRGLRRYFSARRYYLTAAGAVFFYPLYALAPAAEGIPAFLLPWDGEPPAAPVR